MQLFQTNQPVLLPSFDDQLFSGSHLLHSTSVGSTSGIAVNSENHLNLLAKVDEEDCDQNNRSQISKSSKTSLHFSMTEICKNISSDGLGLMKRWLSLDKPKSLNEHRE